MDIAHRLGNLRRRLDLPARVREVSKLARAKPDLAWLRRASPGVSLILVSVILGAYAYEEAGRASLAAWQLAHPPSRAVWTSALASRGFQLVTEGEARARAIRSLPVSLDARGSAWVSDDGFYVAVFDRLPADPEPGVFSRAPKVSAPKRKPPIPKGWDPAGQSWGALEKALELADARRPAAAAKPQGKREAADRRQLQF